MREKNTTLGTVPSSNRKIIEIEAKSIPLARILFQLIMDDKLNCLEMREFTKIFLSIALQPINFW
jgi:hypothetical protein